MDSEAMAQCADLIVADAIQDLCVQTGESLDEVRSFVIASCAYEAIYDFKTGLWALGPDYFAELVVRPLRG